MTTEVEKLKEKLTECDTQKQADKECLKTMQFMVDALTEDKLTGANKVADLEKSIKNLTQQLNVSKDKLATLSELEIENEAKNKRIQRLTDENEEQEMDLRRLDEKLAKVSELSQRQTQELLVLEQSVDRWKSMEGAYQKLQQENKELQAKIEAIQAESNNESSISISQHEDALKSIQIECDNNQRLYDETKTQLNALQEELEELKKSQASEDSEKIDVLKEQLQHENEQLKKQSEEQTYKLSKYKAKICEFSSKLKEVKHAKKLLTETVVDYSNLVTKWQIQISHASKLLIKEANSLNDRKIELKKQLEELKAEIVDLESRLEESLKSNEASDIKEKYEMLLDEHKSLQKDVQEKNSEIDKYNGLNEAKIKLEEQLASNEHLVKDMRTTINQLESRLEEAIQNNVASDFQGKYETLLEEQKSLQKDIEDKNSEIATFNHLKEAKIELEKQLECNENLVKDLKATINELESRLQETTKSSHQTSEMKERYESLLVEYKSLEKNIKEKDSEIAHCNDLKGAKIELEKRLESYEISEKDLKATINELESRLQKVTKSSSDQASETTEKYDALLSEYKSLGENIREKEAEIACNNDLKEAKIELEKQLESSERVVKDLRGTIDELEIRLEEAKNQNETNEVKEKYEMLLIDYQTLQKDIHDKNSEIVTLTQEFEQVCSALKLESEKCRAETQKLTDECHAQSQRVSELQENESVATKKNSDLLAEMRELNDVLKTRGEVISSQAAEIDQIKAKLNEQSKQITALEENLKEKTKQLEQLRNQFDNQSEILSTSTISRADEVARMRDIEDSFEEKYHKLRVLALKLKKKIAEQQTIITNLETKTPEARNAEPVPTPVQTQNLISLQKENDKLLDQIDSTKLEQKQLKADIKQLNQQIKKLEDEAKSLRIVNEDIKATADTNLKIKSALDEKIKAGEKQIEALKTENKNVTQQLKNAENEIIKIKGEYSASDNKFPFVTHFILLISQIW